jgi:membrane protease YdiL (CAAX protease family)
MLLLRLSFYEILKYLSLQFIGGLGAFLLSFLLKNKSTWLQVPFIMLMVVVYMRWSKPYELPAIQIKPFRKHIFQLLIGLFSMCILVTFLFYYEISKWFECIPKTFSMFFITGLAPYYICLAFLEEIFFRGKLYSIIERKNWFAAIIIPSVLFGVFHLSNGDTRYAKFSIIYSTLFGVLLATMRRLTGSIYAGFYCHFLMNAFLVTRTI